MNKVHAYKKTPFIETICGAKSYNVDTHTEDITCLRCRMLLGLDFGETRTPQDWIKHE